MIASPSIAFNDFSGSANDVTARQSKGRTVLTVKPRPTGAPSPSQIVSRNTLSRISRAYKQLSDSQQHAWEILAEHLRSKTVLGYSIKLTAHNAFVRLNCNRALAGEDILWDAPAVKNIPSVGFAALYVSNTETLVESIVQPDSNYKLVVKMSGAMSNGVSNGWSKTVIISSAEEADWGDLDLTESFADVKGTNPENGMKYFVEMYWLDAETGFTGPVSRFSGSAGVLPIAGTGEPTTRHRIKTSYANEYDRTYLPEFDIELSPGSMVATVAGIMKWKNTRSNLYVHMDISTKDRMPILQCYPLGREMGPNPFYRIGLMDVDTYYSLSAEHPEFRLGVSAHEASPLTEILMFDTVVPTAN